MDRPVADIELETMLLGRRMNPGTSRRREGAALDRYSAYVLLSRIRAEGPMSIGQLSDAFGLDASTLNRQTAAMWRAGLVRRIPDPDGGIARKFRITEEGERRLELERLGNIAGLEMVFERWTDAEIAEFAAYLQRFNVGIERIEGRSWPRAADFRQAG
ncbi:MarR family winged helix-turn-helix transcriptional regulator [Nocardia sp. alder85J]|uniref:MarR family winged helix-turn-helix transcriptional regulator n=1 Tax=Nocardia sp. alder85J TaxID=2862949 RepID=UPI001CD5557D|nr:MarR family transcriptional regulator [Nocardia sp. alder85J]MCX4094787.1 MarR family transcriptional regulator [Nocardia sp. alder85J]